MIFYNLNPAWQQVSVNRGAAFFAPPSRASHITAIRALHRDATWNITQKPGINIFTVLEYV